MEGILSLKKAATAVSGKLVNCPDEDAVVYAVSTDTRTITEGAVFVALKGENSDGHKFISVAAEKGALCCIANKDAQVPNNVPLLLVDDTSVALLDLAGAYRREMKIPVVAVTGSVGKTSTRGMIASVLSQKYNTLATEGNFNNEIGVPLTLFRISKENDIAVVEMGMNHFGELSRITTAAKPDTAVITNVGEAHIENLGSREGILKAKLEVLEGLSRDGTVILNGDNDMLKSVNGTLDFETVYFGTEKKCCDVTAKNIKTYAEGSEFNFEIGGREYKATIGVPGRHHIYNALAAIVVGMKYNLTPNEMIDGIREFVPVGMRQAAIEIGEYTVIKDCYNANPTSMRAGLEVLSLKETEGRRVAILGDMKELGTISEKAHFDTGKLVPKYNVDCLITVGECAKQIADGAELSGMDSQCVYSFDNNEQLTEKLYDILKPNDVILLKGSRSMKLEEIAEFMEKKK